jgi:poly(3-hydroxybutyrate) depolymerase
VPTTNTACRNATRVFAKPHANRLNGAPMLYQLHEFQRAMLSPLTAWAQAASKSFANPASPLAYVPGATRLSAGYELLYRLGKDYEKPEFNLHQIVKDGHNIPIIEQTIIEKPFCRLMRFKRFATATLSPN